MSQVFNPAENKWETKFTCDTKGCAVLCDSAHDDAPTVCPAHCEDHDYERADWGGHACKHCGQPSPADWYDSDWDRP